MGYYMQQRDGNFKIEAKNHTAVLEAIKALHSAKSSQFAWVAWANDCSNPKTLQEALSLWRWDADLDEQGNIISIEFDGEKLGDDEILFDAIAPFVEPGSFIEMSGEEGCIWRWSFDGKECLELEADISWK